MSEKAFEHPYLAVDETTLTLSLISGQQETSLPALWLRERSVARHQVDFHSNQRLFNPHELDLDLQITALVDQGETISIGFSDGHSEDFSRSMLMELAQPEQSIPSKKSWRSDFSAPEVDWLEIHKADVKLKAVTDFLVYGCLLVKNVPSESGAVMTVASEFGSLRETNFGRFFEVFSRAESNDLAYRHGPLTPHTDNPYRLAAPEVQLLHCLANDAEGGDSTLVDGLSVCSILRVLDPEAFDLLTRVKVGFRYTDHENRLCSEKPLIALDDQGKVRGLAYSPRLDYCPLLPTPTLKIFHRGRQHLARLLQDPAFEIRLRLQASDLLMFENARVLHGRTEFDPTTGHRHLQGCYIDLDDPQSAYRLLTERRSRTTI